MSHLNVGAHQPDDERARLYVAGRLSSDDAEAFEEHYFSCDACWREVEEAQELREALRGSTRKKSARPAWTVLAAAAVAALVLLSVWQLSKPEPAGKVLWRGSDTTLLTTVTRTNTDTVIRWRPIADSNGYLVRFFGVTGAELGRHTTSTRELIVPREIGYATHYRVQALNELGGVIADSGLQRLSDSR